MDFDFESFQNKLVAVSYRDPDQGITYGITYQVDGRLMAITPHAEEGRYLILAEIDPQDEVHQFRSVPLEWVVGISEAQ